MKLTVARWAALLILPITALLCPSDAALGQKPTYTNDRIDLPRDHAYQQELCRWLGSLAEDELRLERIDLAWDGTVRDAEHGSRLWGYFGYGGPSPGTILRSPPHWFVLDDGQGHGIEGSGNVRLPRWGNEAAVFHGLDLPLAHGGQGNPCFRHPAVARRALVATAIDLMMTDDSHGKIDEIARSDFLGGAMNGWLETYALCREVIDAKTQAAFAAGFERMIDNYLRWKPRDVNTNMDMRAVASAARFYAVSRDAQVRDKCLRTARLFLFGHEDGSLEKLDSKAGTYYPAGYIGENEGPETTYNGVSFYHLLEARCAVVDDPAWAFLDPVLRAMIEFKTTQYFPNIGMYDGPAGYACRTGNSYVFDQRGRPWRDVAAADLFPEARSLVSLGKKGQTLPPLDTISERLRSQIRKLNQPATGGKKRQQPAEDVPMVWEADHAQHWPPDSTFFSRPGWYERLRQLVEAGGPEIALPYDRPGASFSRFFGTPGAEEFWAYRRAEGDRDFGFFVEHVPRTWPYGSWAGGSLQTFWTKRTGILVLATHDKTGDEFDKQENTRFFRVIDQWATDHVWGRAGERIFTTATSFELHATEVKVNRQGDQPSIITTTVFSDDANQLCQPGAKVESRFEAVDHGLRVTKKLIGTINGDELWATIPVYLRHAERHRTLQDTVIDGWVNDAWMPLDTKLRTVSRIRLGRDTGETGLAWGYVEFGEPRRVRLSAEPWQAGYQSRSRIRNIHIDLVGASGVSYALSSEPAQRKQ